MKAILIKDKRLVLSEIPDPVMGEGEVIVRVEAAALNRADLMQREGNYPPPPGAPDWPGLEIAGVVESTNSPRWKAGDRVCALLPGGGYAQKVAVPDFMCMPVPKGLTAVEASAIPEAFATAYLNLFVEGKAKAGDTLLMHAGASGLASVIIPMAKAFGLRVITTVLSADIAAKIGHLGADVVVDTSKEKIADVLKRESEAGRPVDIAIDCLGGTQMGECLPYLAYGCRWIMIATLAGDLTEINMRTVYVKNIRIIGSTLRSKPPRVKAEILASLVDKVWGKIESGEVRPTIYKVMPFERAEDAQEILYRGENVGKVVLELK